MGQDIDQTLKSLDDTRAHLDHSIDELLARLPGPTAIAAKARRYGPVAGGAVVTVGALVLGLRRRSARKSQRVQARINAEELARAFAPPPAESDGATSRTRLVAMLAAMLAGTATVVVRKRGTHD